MAGLDDIILPGPLIGLKSGWKQVSFMGLYDRDYTQADYHGGHGYRPQMRMMFPQMTPVVKWLIIVNVVVYVLTSVFPALARFAFDWLSVYPLTIGMSLQIWRQITYQFLHDVSGFGHIFFNMLILYFLGVMLERTWGSRRFLKFYLMCGVTGGIVYPVLANIGWLSKGQLVGASGGVLGMIAACAILFPNIRVLVFFVFPVKLFIVAIALAGYAIINILQPGQFPNAGGEAAHLGGMVAGAAYVLSQTWRAKLSGRVQHRFGEKRRVSQVNLQVDLNDILDKVHRNGIQSLTHREKRVLKQATELERKRKMR